MKVRKNPDEFVILGDGEQSKSYLYITDVLDAVFLAMTRSSNRINLFNIASQTFVTVNAIANSVIKVMGLAQVKITHTGGKIGWPGDVAVVRINSSKLHSLGWKEKYTSAMAVEESARDLLKSSK